MEAKKPKRSSTTRGVHNKGETGKRTALLFWLQECDIGHYSLKKEKKHSSQPPRGGVAAVIQGKRGGRAWKPQAAGGNQGDACVRQVMKDRVGSGGKQ